MVRLGVNLDHVVTLRQARLTVYPDLGEAIGIAEANGANGITLHLREDRRHIQDDDLKLARELVSTTLNMEMAPTNEMLAIALQIKPDYVCLVPERREELTTEGGLDVFSRAERIEKVCKTLSAASIKVSLFVEARRKVVDQALALGASRVELHTGAFAEAVGERFVAELNSLRAAACHAANVGLIVNAGHGLRRGNVKVIAQLPFMNELNIGHSIIADAIFVGLAQAVRDMKAAMSN